MIKNKFLYILLTLILLVNIINLAFNIKSSNNTNSTEEAYNAETLNEIKIGVSKNYIDSILGVPLTQGKTDLYQYKDKGEIFTKAGYKYGDTVVLCLFEEETLVIFAVIVKDNNAYKVTNKYFLKEDAYLKDFTYNDFCEYVHEYAGNVAGSAGFASYYYEVYPESNSTNNIASFLASYVYIDDSNILHIGQDSCFETDSNSKMTAELENQRTKSKPNMYGEIHPDYIKEFGFTSDLMDYNFGHILFSYN